MLIKNKAQLSKKDLLHSKHGLEREALRITKTGEISKTNHPLNFGDRTTNPYITTDFSEAQLEMITGVCTTIEAAYDELVMINQTVMRSIGDELLWPYSMPPKFNWDDVKIAWFPKTKAGILAREYREYLNEKYDGGVQMISGIHYNFSYSEALIEKLHKASGKKVDYQDFKNDLYMLAARNYLRYHWFLVFIQGKTPVAVDIAEPEARSLRNSKYGYQNKVDLNLAYDSLDNHLASIRKVVADGVIVDEREIYSPIRIKCPNKADMLSSLATNGIQYLEIRSIDLDPEAFAGITLTDLKLIQLFMLCLLEFDEAVDFNPQALTQQVTLSSRIPSASLLKQVAAVNKKMMQVNNEFGLNLTQAAQLTAKKDLTALSCDDFLKLAHAHKETALVKVYQTAGYEDMEMSTQLLIAEAVRRGVKYQVVDRSANFLRLEANGLVEYVKQATKTSLDTYVAYLAMENKEVTKIILNDAGLPVPAGRTFTTVDEALNAFTDFFDQAIVVKPKSTNYGLGIVIFKPLKTQREFKNALEIAFGFDQEVIVEKYLNGQEYRFLVIGDECVAVLKRVGANVVGDGNSTITELVSAKNNHPWRGTDHLAPLEKIVLGDIELHNLTQAGLNPSSILANGEQVFLRDNSNISTGGDSIDVTNEAHEFFKQQAVAATHAIGARICGVDIIIDGDLADKASSYGFIELNFNPAINMHAFTLAGPGQNAAPYVLKQLGLI